MLHIYCLASEFDGDWIILSLPSASTNENCVSFHVVQTVYCDIEAIFTVAINVQTILNTKRFMFDSS